MTPAQYGYYPCPTCGVLAREDWPHAVEFCERHLANTSLDACTAASNAAPEHLRGVPAPAVDVDALWAGT